MAPSKELVAVEANALQSIDPDQTLKASKALLAHIKKSTQEQAEQSTKRNLLHDASDSEDAVEDIPVWLTLATKRHIADRIRLQPGKIALPHSLHANDEGLTVCLITADPQRAYKNIVSSEAFPADLQRRITRVIDFSKLKTKYGQYEAQRKLFSEHDVFLADDRIINRLPKVMGKTFYKTTQKRPVPVVLQPKKTAAAKAAGKKAAKRDAGDDGAPPVNAASAAKIAREIEKALSSALVSLSPTTNTAVRIGWASFTAEQIADNVDAVVTGLVGKWVPQKWRNVRGIYIKGPDTAALPIWLTDELWMDETDVIADSKDVKQIEDAKDGKKRKASKAGAEEAPAGKSKKTKVKETAEKAAADADEEQAAERKSKLKKQKAAARKAMDA